MNVRRLRPGQELYKHFGFTPEAIAERGKKVVEGAAK